MTDNTIILPGEGGAEAGHFSTVSGSGTLLTPGGDLFVLAPDTSSGVLNVTEAPDTFAAVGYAVYPGVWGSLALTEAPDVFAGVGSTGTFGGTTWNPSDKTGIDLSGGDLIASGHSFSFNGMRSTNPKSLTETGKFYFEIACNSAFSDARSIIGFATESAALGSYAPGNNYLATYNKDGTNMDVAGFDLISTTQGAWNGKTVGVAIDFGNKKWWITLDGTTWNACGTANPATGVGSVFWTTQFSSGTGFYIQGTIIEAGATMTLNPSGAPRDRQKSRMPS